MVGAELNERERHWQAAGWWPAGTLLQQYRGHVADDPHGLAVVDESGLAYTHAQLMERAQGMAQVLGESVAGERQVVLCHLPNRADYHVAFVAILIAGHIPSTVPATTDPDLLVAMLDVSRAAAVVVEDTEGPQSVGRACARRSPWRCAVLSLSREGLRTVDPGAGPTAPAHDEGLAHLMFTSSTTGSPKAVIHTEQTLAALNIGFRDRFELSGSTPIFMPSPLGHSVGGIHGIRLALFLGAPLVLQRTWDPTVAFSLVDRHECAFMAAATPFLKDLVDASVADGGRHLASMRALLCGGAQVPPALLDLAGERFPATFITVLWGMTEGGVTTCLPGDPADRVRETAGCGLPGLELRIIDTRGESLPVGSEGELAMRGPGVFRGYLGQEGFYRSQVTDDGFFRTGDRGILDADGYLQVTGRIKDLVIRGGVNLSPVPTENALFRHPDIQAVAVVGVPDDRLGERLCAVVKADRHIELDELVAWCDQQGLPKRLWPERVAYMDEVPRTAAGKLRKHELKDLLTKGDIEVVP